VSDDISIPPPGYYNERHRMSAAPPGPFTTARIALVILAVGGVGAIAASVAHFRHGPVPVIEADNRPIRVRPTNPGGMQIAGANNDIMSGGNDADGSSLAPAPEAPNPQALHAEAPAPLLAPAPATVAPTVTPAPAAPPVTPKPKPLVVAAATPHLAVHGKGIIQLAALESESAARTEWQALQKRLPDVFAGHEPSIGKTERAGRTYWRLRATGFGDVEQAKTACVKVRAKGSACSVADF
jgi:cell division septation protein DedD